MINQIAEALLNHTCHTITAIVWLDTQGRVMDVALFDTRFMPSAMRAVEGAHCAAMLCHHPDGSTVLAAQEMRNWARLRRRTKGMEAELYLCSEYFPCRRIAHRCGDSADMRREEETI